jgi:lipoic acid synthetase
MEYLEKQDALIANEETVSASSAPKGLAKPSWLKVKAPAGENYLHIKDMLSKLKLATVCQEARCPNIAECWGGGTATFMLMGEVCTRGCRFCNVKTGNPKGVIDNEEPEKVGYAIAQMGLEYVVITSVDRDDLPDQGAEHFARTIRTIRENDKKLIVEILTPDFRGNEDCIGHLIKARPHVYAHNIETVARLSPKVRDPRATYQQTLNILGFIKATDSKMYTKSSIMLGLGEENFEVEQTLKDLRSVGCDIVTFGQYLQPTKRHLKVERYVTPEEFMEWQKIAEAMGFLYVASGPLVRSSYRAGEFFMKGVIEKQQAEEIKLETAL